MTLSSLRNKTTREKFVQRIVAGVNAGKSKRIKLNNGIRSKTDLLKRLKKGDSISFGYEALAEGWEKY